jgi:hypothetical protein
MKATTSVLFVSLISLDVYKGCRFCISGVLERTVDNSIDDEKPIRTTRTVGGKGVNEALSLSLV